ncbi:hypothetical protein CCP1ISM_9980001 [Azospirillaceae bacterium]
MPMFPVLDLDRLFDEVSDQELPDRATRRLLAGIKGNVIGWDALLQHPWVVVLGEAGTGKTTEFRRRAEILNAAGRHAFFCRIEDLAVDGLEHAIDPPPRRRTLPSLADGQRTRGVLSGFG